MTPWVLETLAQYDAKATFFCVGENVKKHQSTFRQVLQQGHSIGSHTYNHYNGWGTDNIPYFHNVRRGANIVKTDLFRPPYGRLKPKQTQFLQRHYRIVMWDVLSGDFDPKITKEQCLDNVLKHTTAGSIVVFHDSLKAAEKLKFVLPQVLEHFTAKGYTFTKLQTQSLQRKQTA